MCALLLNCPCAMETNFSSCELASIATGATRRARRAVKSMNGAPLLRLLRPRGGRGPKDRPSSSCGVGTGWVAASVDVKGKLRHDNGLALVCLTLLQMVSRPPPLFSFALRLLNPSPLSFFRSIFYLCLLFSSVTRERGCSIAEVGVLRGQRIFFKSVLLSELARHLGYTHLQIYNTASHEIVAPN